MSQAQPAIQGNPVRDSLFYYPVILLFVFWQVQFNKASLGLIVLKVIMLTIAKFIPVAVIVGALAAFSILLSAWAGYPVWPVFMSWGIYFIAGAKPSRLYKEVIGLTGGILFGYASLWTVPFYNAVFGDVWGLALTIFTAAFIIVMLELTDWFELSPAYFVSFAGYFAYVFGNFAPGLSIAAAMVPFWILIMIGLSFGYLSAVLRVKILEKEGIFGSSQKTVFDKEPRG